MTPSNKIEVNIPDDQQDAFDQAAQSGEPINIEIEATTPGVFNLVSIGETEGGDEQASETGTKPDNTPVNGGAEDTGGTTIPTKNPAVAALILSKRSGK